MADVQIAVVDQQNTQIALAVPGIQGSSGVAASAVTISGATHTLDSGSSGRIILFTSSSDVTVTIPTALPTGFSCLLIQMGTGQVTVSPAVGVTRYAALSATKTAYQYAAASLIRIGVEEYLLSGEVTA
jgi:hypothetical protein